MLTKLKNFSNLVVLPHSIFALPFALAAMIISWTRGPLVPVPSPLVSFFLITAAVVSARTAAMAFNRLVDRLIDAKNPRTESREIPAGKITPAAVIGLTVVSSAVFLWTSWMLGPHCAVLAPFVLAILFLYSFTKRFTHAAHLVLGLALALAPGGAWWVFRPQIELTPILLMAAVILWVAGFDLLYSTQDIDFDRQNGVFSVPSLVGVDRTLRISKGLHLAAFCGFLLLGLTFAAGITYYCGTIALGLLFLGQHKLLNPYDLSKVNRSFFTYNGIISLAYLALVALELL